MNKKTFKHQQLLISPHLCPTNPTLVVLEIHFRRGKNNIVKKRSLKKSFLQMMNKAGTLQNKNQSWLKSNAGERHL